MVDARRVRKALGHQVSAGGTLSSLSEYRSARSGAEKWPSKTTDHEVHLQLAGSRTEGDYSDKDASLQIRQIKIIGDYAITYWLDDAVKGVMIVDVRGADR